MIEKLKRSGALGFLLAVYLVKTYRKIKYIVFGDKIYLKI